MDFEKETTFISRQDINNFPFPYKLWLTVNSETCEFTKWNIDGTELELKIVALDGYLSSPKSIFKIKSRSSFIEQLRSYGFEGSTKAEKSSEEKDKEQSDVWSAYSEFVMNFKHENFLRHRIDLLAKIRNIGDASALASNVAGKKALSIADRMEGDLCFMSYGALSEIQKSRIKHQTILNFQTETMILQEKLHASDLRCNTKCKEEDEEDTVIELSAELFENPQDSVLYMGDEHRTGYAGFYGNCGEEQIRKFFGEEYLPMYNYAADDEGERRIVDLNPTGRIPSTQPIDFQINYSLDAEISNQSEDIQEQHSPSPLPSSALQPIFIADEDEGEDISMDEFIKFKEQTAEPQPVQSKDDSKIKMEVLDEDDDTENEANFKNFFSQYRESLSLLYEKQ